MILSDEKVFACELSKMFFDAYSEHFNAQSSNGRSPLTDAMAKTFSTCGSEKFGRLLKALDRAREEHYHATR